MNTNTTILTLKIPTRLASHVIAMREKVNVYETNRHVKNMMSFIILKAIAPQGVLQSYRLQLSELADYCQCSKQTMLKRINWMQSNNLLSIEGVDIHINGWKQAARLYKLNLRDFTTISYDYTTDKNIYLRLFAAEIEANKERQAYMIQQKLQRNLAVRFRVQAAIMQYGGDQSRLNDFAYLHNAMRQMYTASFTVEPELHKLLCQIRPDCNRGVGSIANAWMFASKQLVSYYKRKMATSGIATIVKREKITSQCRARNEFSHVLWNRHQKQTVLSLVDAIVITSKKVAA